MFVIGFKKKFKLWTCTFYVLLDINKTLENTEGVIKKMANPEKLATYGTQDDEKQNKNTAQYVLDTTIGKQTQIT